MRATRPNHIVHLNFIVAKYFVKAHIIKLLITQFVKFGLCLPLGFKASPQYPSIIQSDSLLYSQLRHQVSPQRKTNKHTNKHLFIYLLVFKQI